MALSQSEKRWIRKMVREEFAAILAEALTDGAQQLGGYDGTTDVHSVDDWYNQRSRIGFHIPHRQDGDAGK